MDEKPDFSKALEVHERIIAVDGFLGSFPESSRRVLGARGAIGTVIRSEPLGRPEETAAIQELLNDLATRPLDGAES